MGRVKARRVPQVVWEYVVAVHKDHPEWTRAQIAHALTRRRIQISERMVSEILREYRIFLKPGPKNTRSMPDPKTARRILRLYDDLVSIRGIREAIDPRLPISQIRGVLVRAGREIRQGRPATKEAIARAMLVEERRALGDTYQQAADLVGIKSRQGAQHLERRAAQLSPQERGRYKP